MPNNLDHKGRKLRKGESQRKNGMYQFRYTDCNGERKTIYSWKLTTLDKVPEGKKDSKSLRELELEVTEKQGQKVSQTVTVCAKNFLEMRADYAIGTQASFEKTLSTYVAPSALGDMLVVKVTKSDILGFYSDLTRTRELGVSALKGVHTLLNSVFQIALRDGIISRNPCKGCLRMFETQTNYRDALTVEEQHALLEYLKDGSNYYSRYYPIVATFLGTGMRASELCGLSWDEVDLTERCINLKHQLLFDDRVGKRNYYVSTLKNGVSRIIPLPDTLVELFWKRLEQGTQQNSPVVDGVTNFVFLNGGGKPFTSAYLNKIFHRLIAEFNQASADLKLPDFSTHVFRHTYCTRLIELGVDLKVVQEIMGHSSAKVTMNVYAHLNSSRLDKEVNRVVQIDLG